MLIMVILVLIVVVLTCLVIFVQKRFLKAKMVNSTTPTISPNPNSSAQTTQSQFKSESVKSVATRDPDFDYFSPVIGTLAIGLNFTSADLENAFKSGSSIAELAQLQRADLSTIRLSVLNSFNTRLTEATTTRKITKDQAQKAYRTAEIWFDELTQLHLSDVERWDNVLQEDISNSFLSELAQILHLHQQDLTTKLTLGKSLASIARTQKAGIEEFKQAAMAAVKRLSDNYLNNLTITQSQADKLYQTVELWWDEIANQSDLLSYL